MTWLPLRLRAHAEEGATSVEYGLLAGAVGVALVTVGPTLGAALVDLVDAIVGRFSL